MNRSLVLPLPHRSFPRGTSAALRAAGAKRRLWPALLFVCALLFALLAAQAHALAHELAHWHVQPPSMNEQGKDHGCPGAQFSEPGPLSGPLFRAFPKCVTV
ncbi:hypothetical protein CCR84_08250 [Rhodocyclus purpureus]|nr:hypothetical protein [Rhodocyclus purpureus]